MHEVTEFIYTSQSGSILPGLQWYEQIVITRNGAVLTRNGRTPDSQVNGGQWEIALPTERLEAFFTQLAAIDTSHIRRIEPDDPPDGGDTESFTIVYANGQRLELRFDPGVTYSGGGEAIASLGREFIRNLDLPVDAGRYE
jgi:hypothetical protein